jgi:hypothetical protein
MSPKCDPIRRSKFPDCNIEMNSNSVYIYSVKRYNEIKSKFHRCKTEVVLLRFNIDVKCAWLKLPGIEGINLIKHRDGRYSYLWWTSWTHISSHCILGFHDRNYNSKAERGNKEIGIMIQEPRTWTKGYSVLRSSSSNGIPVSADPKKTFVWPTDSFSPMIRLTGIPFDRHIFWWTPPPRLRHSLTILSDLLFQHA